MEETGIGQRVEHHTLGEGRVVAVRDHGFSLQVAFNRGPLRWVKVTELKESAELSREVIPVSRTIQKPVDSAQFSARTLIEALRLGIVPFSEVPRFTFGREAEKDAIQRWLRSQDRNFLLMVGEYGAGKTHFLECLHSLALTKGFAVALVELDPNESPLYRPKRVYQRLVESLTYIDRGGERRDFKAFLLDAGSRNHAIWQRHPLLRRIYHQLQNRSMDGWRWEWIQGYEVQPKDDLHDDGPSANVYINLLSSYSVLAKDLLGLKGLLLLFDEAEVIDTATSKAQLRSGLNFLRGLSFVANNNESVIGEDIEYAVISQGPGLGSEWGYMGMDTGLRYSGRLEIPFAPELPTSLKAVFTFAPATILDFPAFDEFERLNLLPLSTDALIEAVRAAAAEYENAYHFLPGPQDHRVLANQLVSMRNRSTRVFIKACIEAFDLLRLFPDENAEELLRIDQWN